MRKRIHKKLAVVFVLSVAILSAGKRAVSQQGSEPDTAIVGATIIDGNGGEPIRKGRSSSAASGSQRRASRLVQVPQGAKVIDGAGKYVTPGFIDTNVHLSLFDGHEQLARYQRPRRRHHARIGAAAPETRHHDRARQLRPAARRSSRCATRIARGRGDRPRACCVAGNIVGWGGPFSVSFSVITGPGPDALPGADERPITQGAGEELMDMTPEELRVAINKYLDKGPDFIKYGGTSHFSDPTFIGFSPEAQKAHRRGDAQARAGGRDALDEPRGLRLSVLAGIDLIQHPEYLDAARDARRSREADSRPEGDLRDLGQQRLSRRGLEEAPQGQGRGREEA